MTNDIEALRAWHKAQLGTKEVPANSNCVRYNNDYYGRQVFGAAYPWCVVYIWAAFRECGLSDLFYGGGKTASCGQYITYAKANGQWVTSGYKPGDLLFFDFTGKKVKATHIGWLDEVSGNTLYTYEGNTSSASDDNGGMVQRRIRTASQVVGAVRPPYKALEDKPVEKTVYTRTNGVDIVTVPVSKFSILMVDERKNSAAKSNYCNAGFFANYSEKGEPFTLPVAHVKADYAATSQWVKHYIAERGTLVGGKAIFDSGKWQFGNEQFYKKSISTLLISGGKAQILDCVNIPDSADYAISGVPVMRNGKDVKFATYVTGQGWAADTVRATYHTFAGLKGGDDRIYVMGWKTTSDNMIKTAEAFRKFKALGFTDVIKLDGGGSYVFNVGGKALSGTVENRRINTIITWGEVAGTEDDDTGIKLDMIKRGSKGAQVKAAQAVLAANGYNIGASGADGDFGAKTESATVAFQKTKGLTADGIIGDKTWEKLLKG